MPRGRTSVKHEHSLIGMIRYNLRTNNTKDVALKKLLQVQLFSQPKPGSGFTFVKKIKITDKIKGLTFESKLTA